MRHARLLSVAILVAAVVSACTTASAGGPTRPRRARRPAPSTAASATAPAEPGGSGDPNLVMISALGIKYEQTTVTAPAGVPFQIVFDNKDAGTPHNVSLHLGGSTGAELFKGTIFNGIESRTYDVPALDAGQYAFVCTVHPTMIGTLNAQ